jgi:hypothetical protein
MFVPPGVPDDQEDSNTPLKKIVLYNGASSWGGGDDSIFIYPPGRGICIM